MELYQLRTFAAVAEAAHLTRAAERLHLSQPAVSGHIKALEQELDVRLFDRVATGMVLTEAGRQLLAHAHKVLSAADGVKQAAKQLHGTLTGLLHIGTVADPVDNRLGAVLTAAMQRHPLLRLDLHQAMSGTALESVRDGRLDATFFFGDAPTPPLAGLPLRQLIYRVAGSRGLGRADQGCALARHCLDAVDPHADTEYAFAARLAALCCAWRSMRRSPQHLPMTKL